MGCGRNGEERNDVGDFIRLAVPPECDEALLVALIRASGLFVFRATICHLDQILVVLEDAL